MVVTTNTRVRLLKGVAAATLGSALILAGVILLVLPGPGLLLIAAGLAVLATRFKWAAKPLAKVKTRAQVQLDQVAQSRGHAAAGAGSACALTLVGILELAGVDLPFINALTAGSLIVSGAFLLGMVLYARHSVPTTDRKSRTGV